MKINSLSAKLVVFLCLTIVYPAIGYSQRNSFFPDDPYFFYNGTERPGFPGQWHLVNQAPPGIDSYVISWKITTRMINNGADAGLSGAWNLGYTGRNVVIGIVDDGVDSTNPDIAPGYRADLSRNFSTNASVANAPQGPRAIDNNHGTAVAGVAAARGGNGIGVTGAAPYAQIAGLRIRFNKGSTPSDPEVTDENYTDAYYWKSGVNPSTGAIEGRPEIQVKNHSYGFDATFEGSAPISLLALNRTASNGVIHVFSAGNSRNETSEDANKESAHNLSSVLVVAALGSDGTYADYSNYGSSVFVTAPSNRTDGNGFGITTTDRTGAKLGYNRYSRLNPSGDRDDLFPDTNYTSGFGGTSSSAPLVSGIMALGKEANPEMDIRMAKHALVKTSMVVDPLDDSESSFGGWRTNAAGNRFNPNYGFGNINAGAFVPYVNNVAYVTEQTSFAPPPSSFNIAIPDDDPAGVTQTISVPPAQATQPLEGVEVDLTLSHAKRGQLTSTITSPSGMASKILYSTAHLDPDKQDNEKADGTWTFLTNAFWGENAAGNWTLDVADVVPGTTGTWKGYSVVFLMGRMVLLTPGIMTQTTDIQALSLTVLNPASTFYIPAGRTFQVSRNVVVDGGGLIVNGQITEKPGAFGNEFGLYSGRVSGTGTITASRGFFNTGGTVNPGNSIGTLNIAGNYIQGPQGKLFIEIASPTKNDLLKVTGWASLNGIVETSWQGGPDPAIGTVCGVFLTAANGISGQFSRLMTHLTPTVMFKPKYGVPGQAYFVVERDYLNDDLLPYLSDNEKAVGGMLNSVGMSATGDLDAVLKTIDSLPSYSQVASSFDQLAPKGNEAAFSMGLSSAIFQAGNISSRLADIRRGMSGARLDGSFIRNSGFIREGRDNPVLIASASPDLTGMLPSGPGEKWGLFVKGNAVSGSQKDTPDQMGYSFTSAGMTLGMDYRFADNLAAGLLLGYTGSRADVDDYGSKVKMDGYNLGVYGTWYAKGFFIDGQASFGWSDYKDTRRIVFPGVDRTASSKPSGRQVNLYGAAGYEMNAGKWTFAPSVSFQYTRINIDSFTESGAGALNLNVDSQKTQSVIGNIGGKIYYTLEAGKAIVMPGILVSYGHEFLRGNYTVTSRLAQGSSPFDIENMPVDRNFFLCGAGISMFLKNGASFHLGYDAQIGTDKYIAHSLNGALRIRF